MLRRSAIFELTDLLCSGQQKWDPAGPHPSSDEQITTLRRLRWPSRFFTGAERARGNALKAKRCLQHRLHTESSGVTQTGLIQFSLVQACVHLSIRSLSARLA